MKQLGDIGQGMKMLLKLTLWHQKQHDQVDGLIVQRIKIDALLGSAKRTHNLVDEIGRRVRNADTKPDTSAHRGFALLDHRGDGVEIFALDFARRDEVVDKLVDGFPAVVRVHAGNNLLGAENIA